jgi:small GTP-binding protein
METNQVEEKPNENKNKLNFHKIEINSHASSNIIAEEEINLLDLNQTFKFNKNEFNFKILFVGDTKVGKTSLISSICDGITNRNYIKTLGCDLRKKKFKIEQITSEVTFFDVGDVDLEYNLSAIQEYYGIVHCCVFILDSTRNSSLEKMEKLIKSLKCGEIMNFLVLNKMDLVESVAQINRKKMLTMNSQKIIELDNNVDSHGKSSKLFGKIFQTSIKNSQSVQEFFNSVLNFLIKFYSDDKNFENYLKILDTDDRKIFFKYKMRKIKKDCVYC